MVTQIEKYKWLNLGDPQEADVEENDVLELKNLSLSSEIGVLNTPPHTITANFDAKNLTDVEITTRFTMLRDGSVVNNGTITIDENDTVNISIIDDDVSDLGSYDITIQSPQAINELTDTIRVSYL